MADSLSVATASPPRYPWFRRRPRLVMAVAAVLFVAVLGLRLLTGQPTDASSTLFVLPVALLTVTFGLRGGVAGGLVAVALILVWAVARDVSLTPTGWLSRTVPVVLLGLLLGNATDRLHRAEAERLKAEAGALLHREAIEINDSLVQGMAAAKWAIESGRVESGLRTLDQTIGQAHDLVSGLIRQAAMGPSAGPDAPPRQR